MMSWLTTVFLLVSSWSMTSLAIGQTGVWATTRYHGICYRAVYGSKWLHEHAVAVSVQFWLHFCMVGGSEDTLSIPYFYTVIASHWSCQHFELFLYFFVLSKQRGEIFVFKNICMCVDSLILWRSHRLSTGCKMSFWLFNGHTNGFSNSEQKHFRIQMLPQIWMLSVG